MCSPNQHCLAPGRLPSLCTPWLCRTTWTAPGFPRAALYPWPGHWSRPSSRVAGRSWCVRQCSRFRRGRCGKVASDYVGMEPLSYLFAIFWAVVRSRVELRWRYLQRVLLMAGAGNFWWNMRFPRFNILPAARRHGVWPVLKTSSKLSLVTPLS